MSFIVPVLSKSLRSVRKCLNFGIGPAEGVKITGFQRGTAFTAVWVVLAEGFESGRERISEGQAWRCGVLAIWW
jgi:hypothetical protein